MVDKKEILRWSKKYDKDQGWWVQIENELGAKFRKEKVLTRDDLIQIVEWKFNDSSEDKKKRIIDAVSKNDETLIERISSQIFSIPSDEDAYRVNSLTMLNGVSPVLASIILTFFDPKRYGIFDINIWRALLGNEPPNLFTAQNYLKLLAAIRKTATKNNLDARTVEKAFYKKHLDEKR